MVNNYVRAILLGWICLSIKSTKWVHLLWGPNNSFGSRSSRVSCTRKTLAYQMPTYSGRGRYAALRNVLPTQEGRIQIMKVLTKKNSPPTKLITFGKAHLTAQQCTWHLLFLHCLSPVLCSWITTIIDSLPLSSYAHVFYMQSKLPSSSHCQHRLNELLITSHITTASLHFNGATFPEWCLRSILLEFLLLLAWEWMLTFWCQFHH